MAKISPVSIKYMVHVSFTAEGTLEKPDVIGAIFGQTEGLLGSDLEMREIQKEGKIGRIEVELRKTGKQTVGTITIPTALDKSETTLIAAAIETIERIGPSDAQLEVEKIEDIRGSKRDYIIERAKKLMKTIEGSSNSREISNTIKDSARMLEVQEYGVEKLPCGDLSSNEVIVVEGRADVINLMKNNVNNVIAMNGTKLPEGIKELSEEKEVTLFVDGDRGGELIIKNVNDNVRVKYIAVAPDGKEVEELTGKEILMNLRKKLSVDEYFSKKRYSSRNYNRSRDYQANKPEETEESKQKIEKIELSDSDKEKLKEISKKIESQEKAIILDSSLNEIKKVSVRGLSVALRKMREQPFIIVLDGTVTSSIISASEDIGIQIIVAKNFATTDTKINLLSL